MESRLPRTHAWMGPERPLSVLARSNPGARWQVGTIVVTICAIVILVVISSASFMGFHPYAVHGFSMQPTIPPGSIAVARVAPASELRPGDVVVFDAEWAMRDGAPTKVIHRVFHVAAADGGILAYTRGDGNAVVDPAPTLLDGEAHLVVAWAPFLGKVYELGLPSVLLIISGLMTAIYVALGRHQWDDSSFQPGIRRPTRALFS